MTVRLSDASVVSKPVNLNGFKKGVDLAGQAVSGAEKLEKVAKVVRAFLQPFVILGYLPDLPPICLNADRALASFTDVTGGIKIFPRLRDWVFIQKKKALEYCQLSAMTGSNILSTAKMVCKFALIALPTPVSLAKDALLLCSFSILTWYDSKRLYQIRGLMKKASGKMAKWNRPDESEFRAKKLKAAGKVTALNTALDGTVDAYIQGKITKWDRRQGNIQDAAKSKQKIKYWTQEQQKTRNPQAIPALREKYFDKCQRELKKHEPISQAATKEDMAALKKMKWEILTEKLKGERKDKHISLAFNIAMICLLVLGIAATAVAISNPVFLSAVAAAGVAAAVLGVYKAFRKKKQP